VATASSARLAVSKVLDYDAKSSNGVDYFELSGTSMAAPQVAGIAALMLQANPGLNPNTVKGILMFTAQRLSLVDALNRPLSDGLSVLTQGAGLVNAVGAVELAQKVDGSVPVGAPWLNAAPSNSSTISGFQFPWGRRVLHAGAHHGDTERNSEGNRRRYRSEPTARAAEQHTEPYGP
jgi:serine protease AprX